MPGESYLGTLGNFLNYSACFAEAEERSPWAPLHVDAGFKPTDSTVSIFFGGWHTQSGYGPRATWKEKFLRCLTADHFLPPLIVMDPLVARGFQALGIDKRALIEWCAENAQLPARDYWDDQWVTTFYRPLAAAGVEPYASRAQAAPDELVKLYTPDAINVIVTGGETQAAFKIFAGRLMRAGPNNFLGGSPVNLIDAWR